ncbi:MAG: SpoIIE family protein phosphatase [Lachnospiraceae bacterium]|nr:SpoIIE family protein phosphatase [Lachnospiraceae bacterium]
MPALSYWEWGTESGRMRKQNSEIKTAFTSEADCDLKNTDYFGFVELDDYACYVVADGIDDQLDAVSARLAVTAAISAFSEAPSIGKRTMRACLNAANQALIRETGSKMKLKASVIVVVTNYVKMRYGQAGNVRLRLYRDGFVRYQSTDQSLTLDLVKEEKVEPDKVAIHEERNNLYAYLGQEKEFHPYISKKIKLANTDAIALYTRGIWENIDEGELSDVYAEASNEPQELVDNVEELLLSRQPKNLGKYTFVTLFVNKVFTDPNKKRRIRRIIMITAVVLVIAVAAAVILTILHNRRARKREKMELGYLDTIEYIQIDNYTRAQERCEEALDLAESLRDRAMVKELGDYKKLIESVLAAQEHMDGQRYADAQRTYREAAARSVYVDSIGLDYINDRLALTADYISVYDLINLGDVLAQNLQYDKAEEKYLEAKAIAGKIYFDDGRKSAIEALEKLYEDQKAEKEAEEADRKEQQNQQESGANYVTQGDVAFAQGDYEGARVYYLSAQQLYSDMGDQAQQTAVEEKLQTTEEKIEEKELLREEAEGYVQEAEEAAEAKEYTTAKKYYLLAKDVYASLKMDDKVEEMTRKMERLDIKIDEQEAAAGNDSAAVPTEDNAEITTDDSAGEEEKLSPGMVLE